ncbi:Helicase required for RNAi-mediated heterochromatin assembly 1 [Diplonema papillatum]|nr:Helicase required for RNAi-mediated heterochromatin assembly 1 [Diplonema papillatum]
MSDRCTAKELLELAKQVVRESGTADTQNLLVQIINELYPRGGRSADVKCVVQSFWDLHDENSYQSIPCQRDEEQATTVRPIRAAIPKRDELDAQFCMTEQLKRAEAEAKRSAAQLDAVTKELKTSQDKFRQLQPGGTAAAQLSTVTEQLKRAEAEAKRSAAQLDAVTKELKTSQDKFRQLQPGGTAAAQLSTVTEQLKRAEAEAKRSAAQLDAVTKELKTSQDSFRQQLSTVKEQLKRAEAEAKRSAAQLDAVTKELKTQDQLRQPDRSAAALRTQLDTVTVRSLETPLAAEGKQKAHKSDVIESIDLLSFKFSRSMRPKAAFNPGSLEDDAPNLAAFNKKWKAERKTAEVDDPEKFVSEFLVVDQDELVDALSLNMEKCRRVMEVALDFFARNPHGLATFLWNFNVCHTARYTVSVENVLECICQIRGFSQMLQAICHVKHGAEVVAWVIERVYPTFPALKDNLEELLAFLIDESDLQTFPDGLELLARLKTLRTGQEHRVVFWRSHENDPEDFHRVELLPIEAELQGPLDPTRLLLLSYTTFTTCCANGDVPTYLDRQFRILREDYLGSIRNSYQCVFGNAQVDPNVRKQSVSAEFSTASGCINQATNIISVTGTYELPQGHPLLRGDRNTHMTWLRESKQFFADDAVVLLRHNKNQQIYVGQVRRGRPVDYPPHHWKVTKESKQKGTLKITIDVANVPRINGQAFGAAFDCSLVATRVQWRNVALVLKSLQSFHTTIPFQRQLLSLCSDDIPCSAEQRRFIETADLPLSIRQREALETALVKKVTLIQGPPGTGKTHVGTHLISMLIKTGPVLIMAYSNHALDQLLELVLQQGVANSKFLRLGKGAKRPCVQEMEKDLQYMVSRDKHNLQQRNEVAVELEYLSVLPSEKLHPVYHCLNVQSEEMHRWVKQYDPKKSPCKPDWDFFWNLWKNGKVGKGAGEAKMFGMLHCGPQLQDRLKAFQVPVKDRAKQIEKVEKEFQTRRKQLLCTQQRLESTLDEARQQARATDAVDHGFRVVGCTTSFAAKNQAFLRHFAEQGNVTLLVEEAGEILEPDVVACLSEKLERMVMIGDHKQLPPKVEQYAFQRASGQGYNLNCSLFERMIEGGYHYVALDVQHRMFKKLSKIVAKLSYPGLKDGVKIAEQPETLIPGVANQLFFLDHRFPEGQGDQHSNDSASKQNVEEAKLIVKTVWYLTHQGVLPSQIAIITPYLGQVRLLRQHMEGEKLGVAMNDRDLEDIASDDAEDDGIKQGNSGNGSVRISTIDNFQGEEADYVLISLVRSNAHGNIGWLKEAPRITVLLSRAKKGLLVFGNKETLTKRSIGNVWPQMLNAWWPEQDLGKRLALCCHRHADESFAVATAADFASVVSPEGGCPRICAQKLSCGHFCQLRCHRTDPRHVESQCTHLMQVECTEKHRFEAQCHEATKGPATYTKSCPQCRKLREIESNFIRSQKQAKERAEKLRAEDETKQLRLKQKIIKETQELTDIHEENERRKARAQLEFTADQLELEKKHKPDKLNAQHKLLEAEHANRLRYYEDKLLKALQEKQADIDNAQRLFHEEIQHSKESAAKRMAALEEEQIEFQKTHGERRAEAEAEGAKQIEQLARKLEADRAADVANTARALKEHRANVARCEAALPDLAADQGAYLDRRIECQVCSEALLVRDASHCGSVKHRHWMDLECFTTFVESAINNPEPDLLGELACPFCKADDGIPCIIPFSLAQTFLSGNPELAERLLKHRTSSEVGMEVKKAEERVRKELEDEKKVDRLYRKIAEESNNKCPQCKAVFLDYTNCSALTCKCNAHFCAFCFKDCGRDAHAHVARCPENPNPGEVYVPEDSYNAYHHLRRQLLTFKILASEEKEVQTQLWGRFFDGAPYPESVPQKTRN